MLHVTQLDRIVDVVEETSKGRVVTLLVAWHFGWSSFQDPQTVETCASS